MKRSRQTLVRATLACYAVAVVVGLAVGAAHQPAPPADKKHTPLSHQEPAVPYLDAAAIAQQYVPLAGGRRAVAREAPRTAATVGEGAAAVVEAELAPAKVKTRNSTPARVGDKWFCTYQLQYEGIPLAHTSDALCIVQGDGRATAIRKRNIPKQVNATKAEVEAKAAVTAAEQHFKERTKADRPTASDPALEIWVDAEQAGRLCWTVVLTNNSDENPQAARYWVAAVGEARVVAVENLIHHNHEGTVTGSAWETTPFQPARTLGLGFVDVTRTGGGGGTRPTGLDGRYSFNPGFGSVALKATLAGQYCVIEDKGGTAVLNRTKTSTSPIDLDFNTTTEAEIAQVSGFRGTNEVHEFAREFLLPSHLYQLPTRVNIKSTCNAFFSGGDVSINFFNAGSGCPNTAYSDVIYHEYGHAIDFALGGILDGGYSEGFGDALAILITRQPCVGRDFFGSGTCLRDYATLTTTWPPSSPEVHFVGQIYGGFTWELIQQLQKEGRCGPSEDAFGVARRLVLAAAVGNPKDIPDAVLLSFLADDDDGDLSNGSPHFAALAAAADARKIPRPSNATVVLPRLAYVGCAGKHHLAENTGTAYYCWAGFPWLTTLHHDETDDNFFYYCEQEFPDYRWAFARKPNCCGEYAVWFLPDNEVGGRWVLYQNACVYRPVNADAKAAKALRP